MVMNKQKFIYFLNAVLYCMWKRETRVRDLVERSARLVFSPINRLLSIKKGRRYKRIIKIKIDKYNRWNENPRTGFIIGFAKDTFLFTNFCYTTVFSFPLIGLYFKEYGGNNKLVTFVVVAVPFVLMNILVKRLVFYRDKYLEYFEFFIEETEQWYKKWKRITLLFRLGAIVTLILGAWLMCVIRLS